MYRAWEGRLSPTMRQAHPAGERMFVDYAGQTVDLIDPGTGEIRPAQIFVAVMGASNYTYAEATQTQSLPDWVGAHVRTLAFMGGVPAQLVPDNPKVGIDRANWYEPGLNRTYLDLATHYGTAILPTRTRNPRDKVEVARAGIRALDIGAAEEPPLLLAGRAEPGDRRAGCRPQCPADAPPRHQPA